MNYLLICEIGPIFDFVRHSRKTKDFWAAPFLFSYFMAEVVKRIGEDAVFLPYLKDNPMITGKGKITAGSIPDQLYFLLDDESTEKVKEILPTAIKDIVADLKPKIEKAVLYKEDKSISLTTDEINKFFNFFYIVHEIKADKPTYDEFIEAERKIKMRAAFKPFDKSTDAGINKWDKCNLCGDRLKIYERKIDKGDDLLAIERICNVCLRKRYLPEAMTLMYSSAPDIEFKEPCYPSTSDIALSPIKECIEKADNEIKSTYKDIVEQCKNESEEKDSEGRYFYDPDFRRRFNDWKEAIKRKYPEELKLNWLNRPFYAIVYMDGDNMGEVLKKNKNDFKNFISNVSKNLSDFSNGVNEIITKHHGQLIFAGGEDVIFVIHPEYLLDCINELRETYNKLFAENELTKLLADKFTLSAGAIVCYHKYPLSEAIHRAGMMLKDHAKQRKGKNATAISLIKGHTEALDLTFSNSLIDNLKKLKECLIKSEISRTTPYRIEKHKELFGLMPDDNTRKNFLYTIIAGTRNPEKINPDIEEIVKLLLSFRDTETMINALLFARFLSGENR